jgi:hypothetical protein
MKKLGIFFFALLGACSDGPKFISTKMDFHEVNQSASSEIYSNLDVIVKMKKIETEVFWSLDIFSPEMDITPEKDMVVRKVVFHWLKNPDPVSGSPYISIEFKDDDGFMLESANNQHKTISLAHEFDEKRNVHIDRLRTQGSFIDKKSRFGSISSCDVKVVCNKKSQELLSSWMKSTLQEFDEEN